MILTYILTYIRTLSQQVEPEALVAGAVEAEQQPRYDLFGFGFGLGYILGAAAAVRAFRPVTSASARLG